MDDIVATRDAGYAAALQPIVTTRSGSDDRGARARRARRPMEARRARVGQAVAARRRAGHSRAADVRELARRAAGGAGDAGYLPSLARLPCRTPFSEGPRPACACRGGPSLVGPEGGWTDAEWTTARERGIRLKKVTLGARTLRADAVAVAAISVLQFFVGDL